MGEAEPGGSEISYYHGSAIRDGKIYAQNSFRCMEAHYNCAYNLGGADRRWPGWISVDLKPTADLQADIRQLPIASETADAVAAIHVLEHFYLWEVADLLREWKRILKPGGIMIIEVPCLDKIFAYIAECIQKKDPMHTFVTLNALYGDPKHRDPLMCHKWGYMIEHLRRLLEFVGMRNIVKKDALYHFRFRDVRFECIK